MTFLRTNGTSRDGLIVLVLFALVFTPFVNAAASAGSFLGAGKDAARCDKMQKMDTQQAQSEQIASNCCNDQYSSGDCKTHCQNLLLSHLPVTALLEPFAFQPRSLRSVQLSSSKILRGVFTPLDPRPPRV